MNKAFVVNLLFGLSIIVYIFMLRSDCTLEDFEFIEIKDESPYSFQTYRFDCTMPYTPYSSKRRFRPIVGDHVHQGIAISVDGKPYTLRDRNLTEPVPYEDFKPSDSCPNPPRYAYIKQWYHTGVHTHCDNIIHIHPWSAPKKLRVEGKDVTFKLWMESVGIEVGSLTNVLRVPGDPRGFRDGWTLEYYAHVNDEQPAFTTKNVEEMANLWLVDHHAFIKLYLGSSPEKQYEVLNYYSKSKFGEYPNRLR
jgi:hypothetical protein